MDTTESTAELYRRLSGQIAERIGAVDSERWDDPSPCAGWSARDVVTHLIDTETQMLAVVGLPVPAGPAPQSDPVAAWRHTRTHVQAVLDDPVTAHREYEGHFGPTDLAATFRTFYCLDLVVHGWDLARATGLDETIDDADLDFVEQIIARFGDALYMEGVCAPAVPVGAHADRQTRVLAALGRAA